MADEKPPAPSLTKSCTPDAFRRHAFVRLAVESWQDAVCESGDTATLREWLADGRPLIVRRPCLTGDGRYACLGLALPGKRRLAYRVPVARVLSIEPPPLAQGIDFSVPGFELRLFGSHAWQRLTGLSYVTETSDIDLLLDLSTLEEWRTWLSRAVALPSTPQVDLEIVIRGDASFSWREYLGPAHDILIKSNRSVELVPKDHLTAFFP